MWSRSGFVGSDIAATPMCELWIRDGLCPNSSKTVVYIYVRVDMPGVPKDNFTVSVKNGRVMVTGQAPATSHISSGRFYSGDVAMLSTRINIPSCKIKTIIAKNGVIRLVIPHSLPFN
ncbi:putative 57 kDa heat shock protein [Cardamine amara subsp. amara]|uniref:57 kDa heat shock protein n=1 Tax=Cardamine amara subsp. amara TaxID=228776 RepID=A0ABD0ZTJ4_CARAN